MNMASPIQPASKSVDDSSIQKGYEVEGGQIEIDQAKQRKLVRKLDMHVIPVVMLLYLLSFLDRLVN